MAEEKEREALMEEIRQNVEEILLSDKLSDEEKASIFREALQVLKDSEVKKGG